MVGKTLGHYRILEKIGAGGMGEVYRAHDDHLDRDVAIKVLPTGTLADEGARKRFRKEALALSKLNHPNIQTVHDFDTQDGVDFLVSEYIPGVTLSDKLNAGPLAEKEVVRLGMQLAEGLAAAHEQNVIHRDLKPGNLRLTRDGRLKILDFGLARLIQPFSLSAPTASVTETGAVAGTLPYMAPEQLRGEKADARSDIYAEGCVLYELATGRRPFEQKLGSALAAAIVHEPPPPPGRLQPDLSSDLERIILKCLEKDPENRYQSAKELIVDLRRLASLSAVPLAPSPRAPARGTVATLLRSAQRPLPLGIAVILLVVALLLGFNVGGVRDRLWGKPAAAKIDSLAVLPLENLSRDPEQEYFADGMTEALITELSKISALKVISRTSAMQYKGVKKPMPQIARELGVDGVIEGSVQREGDQVRITVQLIHGPTDNHLWAESYQRELRSILALQGEVARDIAGQIQIKLTPQEQARLARSRPVNPEAQEEYLKGRYLLNKATAEDVRKSLEFFERAIEKDPSYAAAYAAQADAYMCEAGIVGPQDAVPKAKMAALKALELDDTLAESHASLAVIQLLYDWDWRRAEQEFQRALKSNPGDAQAHAYFAAYLAAMGRLGEAVSEARRAQQLDPLSLITNTHAAEILYFARQYDLAIQHCRNTLELDPNFVPAHFILNLAYVQKQMFDEAAAEQQKGLMLAGEKELATAFGRAYSASGYPGALRKQLDEYKKRFEQGIFVSPYPIAADYALLGEKDSAFAWLEKAHKGRAPGLITLKVDPRVDSLRDDPRFKDLLRRMNFPE